MKPLYIVLGSVVFIVIVILLINNSKEKRAEEERARLLYMQQLQGSQEPNIGDLVGSVAKLIF